VFSDAGSDMVVVVVVGKLSGRGALAVDDKVVAPGYMFMADVVDVGGNVSIQMVLVVLSGSVSSWRDEDVDAYMADVVDVGGNVSTQMVLVVLSGSVSSWRDEDVDAYMADEVDVDDNVSTQVVLVVLSGSVSSWRDAEVEDVSLDGPVVVGSDKEVVLGRET